jgi:hypothetical protein
LLFETRTSLLNECRPCCERLVLAHAAKILDLVTYQTQWLDSRHSGL